MLKWFVARNGSNAYNIFNFSAVNGTTPKKTSVRLWIRRIRMFLGLRIRKSQVRIRIR
jgi:hypothetical protein